MVLEDSDYKPNDDDKAYAHSEEAKQKRDDLFSHKVQDIISYILSSQQLITACEKKAKQYPNMDTELAEVIRQEKNRIADYRNQLREMGY